MILCSCKQRSGGNEVFKGCNYFKWLNEDNGYEKDATIGRQRRKIYTLEKAIAISNRWVKILSVIIVFLFFVNVILVCKLVQKSCWTDVRLTASVSISGVML